jgi:hypothetical protein
MMVLLLRLKWAVRNVDVPSVNRGAERKYVISQRNSGHFDKHSRPHIINSLWLVQTAFLPPLHIVTLMVVHVTNKRTSTSVDWIY